MYEPSISRRGFLGAGLAAASVGSIGVRAGAAGRVVPDNAAFTLKETAGLRRFGYPVHTVVPGVASGDRFRLKRDGKVVPAQFRWITLEGEKQLALDFTSSIGPLEAERYVIETVGAGEPSLEPKGGTRVEVENNAFIVANGSSLAYNLRKDLGGFLSSLKNARLEFLRSSSGFSWLSRSDATGSPKPLGSLQGAVTRQGPLTVALRFTSTPDSPLKSTIDLTFPSSKSWVQVDWSVDDPEDQVAGLGIALNLLLEGSPTLVDLGANDTVYGFMKEGEWMSLDAGPSSDKSKAHWRIRRGKSGTGNEHGSLFAAQATATPAEGWAHVMDRSRCTAAAVADFGRSGADQIRVAASGALDMTRHFPDARERTGGAKERKTLRFWLHFVTNPVQIGAVTSPQAMLAPLDVTWLSEVR